MDTLTKVGIINVAIQLVCFGLVGGVIFYEAVISPEPMSKGNIALYAVCVGVCACNLFWAIIHFPRNKDKHT